MIYTYPLAEYRNSNPTSADMDCCGEIPTLVVKWDNAPDCLWTLRLCEYYGTGGTRWEYPLDVQWQRGDQNSLSYKNHPVSRDRSIEGTASVSATIKNDELLFEVALQNNSSQLWPDAWGWICLIHRWADAFQANCELSVESADYPWAICASLKAPKERWLKWCPVEKNQEAADRIGKCFPNMWQSHIHAKQGAVRAWRMHLKQPTQQFVELFSENAIILGWSHWPCTDMGIYFGAIAPGDTKKISGRLKFYEKEYQRI